MTTRLFAKIAEMRIPENLVGILYTIVNVWLKGKQDSCEVNRSALR